MHTLETVFQHPIIRILIAVFLIYVGFIVLLAFIQRRMIYYPSQGDEAAQRDQAKARGWSPWLGADEDRLGWRVDISDAPGRLVIFHGNAGNALMREYWVHAFARIEGDSFGSIYIFEYPGYGGRPGEPGQAAFQNAARAALEDIRAEAENPKRSLFVLGESIGSGVAAWLAAQYPDQVDGLLLVTPFTRLSDVARAHFPYVPVQWFLRDNYNPAGALRTYPGPVAFIIAAEDTVVPTRIQNELAENYKGRSRRWVIEEADHNTLFARDQTRVWTEVAAYLTQNAGSSGE